MNRPIRTPPRVPAMGTVAIHEMRRRVTRCQLTAFSVPLQRPTPTVAPVMHMEVDTGREYCENTRTVMAAPISMEQPRRDKTVSLDHTFGAGIGRRAYLGSGSDR